MLPKLLDPEKLFNDLYCKFKDSVIHSNTNYYLPFYDAIFEIVMTGCQIKSMHYDVDDNEKNDESGNDDNGYVEDDEGYGDFVEDVIM